MLNGHTFDYGDEVRTLLHPAGLPLHRREVVEFDYGDEVRTLLHRFAVDDDVDVGTAAIYFRACSRHNP